MRIDVCVGETGACTVYGMDECEDGCVCVCMLKWGELRRMLPMKVCTDSSVQ